MKNFALVLSIALALALTGCGSTATPPTPGVPPSAQSTSYLGTQSGNDRWLWTFTGSQFTAANEVQNLHYSGTFRSLPNGFEKLNITTSDDAALTTLPAVAYALAMNGEALLVKPSTQSQPTRAIVAAGLGHCPTSNSTYSWVAVPKNAWDNSNFAVGQSVLAIHPVSGVSSIDMSLHFDFFDGSLQANSFPTGYTCSDGRISQVGDVAQYAVSKSGIYVANCGPVLSGLMGVVDPAINFTIAELTGPGHTFRGMLFQNQPTGDQTTLVWAQGDLNVGFHMNTYSDVDSGIESQDTTTAVQIALATPTSLERYPGTLTDAAGAHDFQFVIACLRNGKYVLFGFGSYILPGGVTVPYNVVLLEQ